MKIFTSLGVIAILLLTHTAFSEEKDWLYQAEVPVASQLPEVRNAVLPAALAQVIVKISGDSQALENPEIKSALQNADTWLQAFSYVPATEDQPRQLIAHFSPKAVNKLLHNAEVAVWGENRPVILGWIAYEAPAEVTEIIQNDVPDRTAT